MSLLKGYAKLVIVPGLNLLVILGFASGLCATAHAQTDTFIGGSGNWSVNGNWSLGMPPS